MSKENLIYQCGERRSYQCKKLKVAPASCMQINNCPMQVCVIDTMSWVATINCQPPGLLDNWVVAGTWKSARNGLILSAVAKSSARTTPALVATLYHRQTMHL